MTGCCEFGSAAEQHFDRRKAAAELERYRTNGPGPTTRLLEAAVVESGAASGLLLDVGAGIGGLTVALLERGVTRAVAVEASSAYIAAAQEEAHRRGCAASIEFVHGDFVSLSGQLPRAAVVTLDRVVCCYPACELLLAAALGRAERCLALSYPRDVWYVRAGVVMENAGRKIARNPFRTYAHPARTIRRVIEQAGFRLSSRSDTWTWTAEVYLRQ